MRALGTRTVPYVQARGKVFNSRQLGLYTIAAIDSTSA
jgi:hypothetical protein